MTMINIARLGMALLMAVIVSALAGCGPSMKVVVRGNPRSLGNASEGGAISTFGWLRTFSGPRLLVQNTDTEENSAKGTPGWTLYAVDAQTGELTVLNNKNLPAAESQQWGIPNSVGRVDRRSFSDVSALVSGDTIWVIEQRWVIDRFPNLPAQELSAMGLRTKQAFLIEERILFIAAATGKEMRPTFEVRGLFSDALHWPGKGDSEVMLGAWSETPERDSLPQWQNMDLLADARTLAVYSWAVQATHYFAYRLDAPASASPMMLVPPSELSKGKSMLTFIPRKDGRRVTLWSWELNPHASYYTSDMVSAEVDGNGQFTQPVSLSWIYDRYKEPTVGSDGLHPGRTETGTPCFTARYGYDLATDRTFSQETDEQWIESTVACLPDGQPEGFIGPSKRKLGFFTKSVDKEYETFVRARPSKGMSGNERLPEYTLGEHYGSILACEPDASVCYSVILKRGTVAVEVLRPH